MKNTYLTIKSLFSIGIHSFDMRLHYIIARELKSLNFNEWLSYEIKIIKISA
jgi:hypothetical protein